MNRVKIGRPLISLTKLCYLANRPLLLSGAHGIGKSQILEAAAKELGIDFICRDLSLMEPPDLVGMPKVDNGVTRFLPPAFLPIDGKGLLVFEELNRCPSYMRAPCLQLLTARCLNDYQLPPDWLPMAAINPCGGDYDVSDLDPALLSRFVLAEGEPDQDEWLLWARANGVHAGVIDYVSADAKIFIVPNSNPRSWKYVSDLLLSHPGSRAEPEILRVAIAGLVGDKRAAAFLATLKTRIRPLTADEILSRYDQERSHLVDWIDCGRLDLVEGSLLAIKKRLQAKGHFDEVKRSRPRWKRLGEFLADLPGDLREDAESFFRDRNYILPPTTRS